jgi:tetratricopeptide (TPR) repeat protein
VEDAPNSVELVEALAALEVRLGQPRDAERRLNAALALAPGRTRLYALLSQALRAQGNLDGALAAVESAHADAGADPLLTTEKGVVLAAWGDFAGAAAAWREVLAGDAVHAPAFTNLAALALRDADSATGQWLIDAALASTRAHPDVLRRAVQLALATEGEGLSRASRVARLCGRLLEMNPGDAWASLALAKSQAVLGDVAEARVRLAGIEQSAPRSAPAAEAQTARLAIDDPAVHEEVQRVLKAAQTARSEELRDVAARARRVATLHASWPAWVAAAVAERRRGRWAAARGALEVALEMAPGASVAHVELAEALMELDDAAGALEHAERAVALEGESPRVTAVRDRARKALRPKAKPVEGAWWAKAKGALGRWTKK